MALDALLAILRASIADDDRTWLEVHLPFAFHCSSVNWSLQIDIARPCARVGRLQSRQAQWIWLNASRVDKA